MGDWAGTRAEREWLATLRRLADALERIADAMEKSEPKKGETDESDLRERA